MASPAQSGRSTPSYAYAREEPEYDSDSPPLFSGPSPELSLIQSWRRTGPKSAVPTTVAPAAAQQPLPPPSSTTTNTTTTATSKEVQTEAERLRARIALGASSDGTFTNCPPMTGKIKNQYSARKTVTEALADCGDDEVLRKCVIAATECEEYKAGKSVPPELLQALCEVSGGRSQTRCRFPGCGRVNVRTDRAKEHARVHIGNHPFKCTKIQADESIGCGATFLRKHDRNRHNNGSDTLTCEDCGANIQGKGREYNLQRHRSNYCHVRKAAKQNEQASGSTSAPSHGRAGPQATNGIAHASANGRPQTNGSSHPSNGTSHTSVSGSPTDPGGLQGGGPGTALVSTPTGMQSFGPVTTSSPALPPGNGEDMEV